MANRRTTAGRTSGVGIFRTPSQVQFRRRRRLSLTSPLRDKAGSDSFTFSISQTSAVLIPTPKAGTDAFHFSITETDVRSKPIDHGPFADTFHFSFTESELVRKDYFGHDTFNFSITDTVVKHSLAPTIGTRVSPPLAIPEGPISGSRIFWDYSAPAPFGSGVLVETSVDNGASYQTATSGEQIPRLVVGTSSVRAVLVRVTLFRASSDDLSPRVHSLKVEVDIDDTTNEYVPLGVFTINELDISDTGLAIDGYTGNDQSSGGGAGSGTTPGIEIDITGNDLSRKISRNQWDAVYTVPTGTNFGVAIASVISNRLPGTQFNFASTAQLTPTLTFGAQGQNDPWADVLDCAESIGMEIFFDTRGICVMRPEPDPDIQESVWTFSDASNPVMVDLSRRITDEDTFNYIIVTGENSSNTDADGNAVVPARGVAIDTDPTSPTYYQGPYGTVTYRVSSPLVQTDDQAVTMAQAVLTRHKYATEIVEIDVVPAPFIEPSDIVEVQRDLSKLNGKFLVDGTTIPLGAADPMHLVTRRKKLAESRPIGGGVGGLGGEIGGGDGGSGDPDSFTIAFGACCNFGNSSSAWTHMKNASPDYFVHLGDVWYDDGGSGHVAHWNSQFANTQYAAFVAALPNPPLIMWSDHDFGFENNATGVGNPITATANAAYRTKFTSSPPGGTLPSNGIYRTWTRGRIRFIMLDMLTFKSTLNATDNSSKTMLGSVQKAWYKNLLASNDFPLIVVFGDGQIPGPVENGQDEWRGYSTERGELATVVGASPATVLYLNGDTHCLGYGHNQYGYDRIWQSAPFHNNSKVKAAGEGYVSTFPTNADEGDIVENYSIVTFTDNGSRISATFRGYNNGSQVLSDTVTA